MALPDSLVIQVGAQIVLGVSGSFNPVDDAVNWAGASGSITDVLTLASLADGSGRQSAKVDLGASRAPTFGLYACVDFTGETPTQGEVIEYYWAPSPDGTDAVANVGGTSGVDAAAPDSGLGSLTLADMVKLCIFIGNLVVHDGVSVQNGFVGMFIPPARYGQLIVKNESGTAFEADDVEMHHVIEPINEVVID
jgi:hypothetical protein